MQLLLHRGRPWITAAFVLFGQARYEQHICELQQQLEAARAAAEPEGRRAQPQTSEEELQRLQAAHQQRERALQDQVQALQQQLKHKVGGVIPSFSAHVHTRQLMLRLQARSSPGPRQQQADAAFGVRIERLNKELGAKTRTIQELSRSLERLQKERRSAPPASSRQPQAENRRTESRPPPGAATPPSCSPAAEESFPAAGCQKTYRPTVFTGTSAAEGSAPHTGPLKLCSPLQTATSQTSCRRTKL